MAKGCATVALMARIAASSGRFGHFARSARAESRADAAVAQW
jgi:hypothetical protein